MLDNTGSMASNGKIQALKSSTNELINILFGDQNAPSHLKMSLVPFSQTVKVDKVSFLNNGYMDINGQSSSAKLNFDNNKYAFAVWATMSNKSWGGCVEARPSGYEETDDEPSAGTPDTLFVPYFEPDGPDSSAYSGYTTYVSDGAFEQSGHAIEALGEICRAEQDEPERGLQHAEDFAADQQQSHAAEPSERHDLDRIHAYCARRIVGLAHLVADGALYGRQRLRRRELDEGDGVPDRRFEHDRQQQHVAQVELHGVQLICSAASLGTTNAGAAELEQDARTRTVCKRIKDAGIRVYTILLEENAQRAKDLMRDCAYRSVALFRVAVCRAN